MRLHFVKDEFIENNGVLTTTATPDFKWCGNGPIPIAIFIDGVGYRIVKTENPTVTVFINNDGQEAHVLCPICKHCMETDSD